MAWVPDGSVGAAAIAAGGTGSTSVITTPTADSWAGWDANSNFSANNILAGMTPNVTAGGTTTLTAASSKTQVFIGTLNEDVVMPDVTTLQLGQPYNLVNRSSGTLTVKSSGGDLIQEVEPQSTLFMFCLQTTGTDETSWNWLYIVNADVSGAVLKAPSGDQTITGDFDLILASGDIQTFSGNFIAGSDGEVGFVTSFPPTAGMGTLTFQASDNQGNYFNTLTNFSTSQSQTWYLPDASGTIALTADISAMAVLLSPGAAQTITSNDLILQAGEFHVGTAAGGGSQIIDIFAPTANMGVFQFLSADTAGNFIARLTHAAITASRTWTLPDATGTLALTSGIPSLGDFTFTGDTMSNSTTNANITITPNGSGYMIFGHATTNPLFASTPDNSLINYGNPGTRPGYIIATAYSASTNYAGTFNSVRSRSASLASNAALQAGDNIGLWDFRADTGTTIDSRAQILGSVTTVATKIGTQLQFYTASNASASTVLALTLGDNQSATFANQVFCPTGYITSGSAAGGFAGNFAMYSPTAGKGTFQLLCADSASAYNGILTNASMSASRTWTMPDASGTVALAATSATPTQVQQLAFNYGVDTGIADAYIVNLTPAVATLTDGLLIAFTALNANVTNAPTITVNGNTAPVFTTLGTPISFGDFGQGGVSYLMYSDGNGGWLYLNAPISNVTSTYMQGGGYVSGSDTGVADSYVVSYDAGGGNYSPGVGALVSFLPAHSNTGVSTITVGGVSGSIGLMNGDPLPAGALLSTKYAYLVFCVNSAGSLVWVLQNPQGIYVPTSRTAGFKPVSVSGTSQALVAGGNYMFNNAAATTGTLPTSANSIIGDTIKVKGNSSAAFIIQANTGQIIKDGSNSSTTAGTATSAAGTDSIQLVYIAANTWSTDFTLSSGFTLA